jgi:hypothetical protein
MKLTYCGDSAAVTLADSGLTVKRGETVEIEDDRLASDLIDQGWTLVKPAKSASAPKGTNNTPKEG